MRVMVAGTKSGAGKTSITCGLIGLLKKHGYIVSSLKCGPDYIDPMFHRQVLGIPSGNIDCFMTEKSYCINQVYSKEKISDIVVMEGVMGYFDGIGFSDKASSYEISKITNTPTILVVDASGTAISIIAVIKGFMVMDYEHNIKGIIFNRLSQKLYEKAADEVRKLGLIPCGYVPNDKGFSLKSRHLGLVTPSETNSVNEKLNYISDVLETTLDYENILHIMQMSSKLDIKKEIEINERDKIRVAVACDNAFCFIYDDLWQTLENNSIIPVKFSPLSDSELPRDVCGIYLCGGYPENHLKQLSENISMLEGIKSAYEQGIPIIAECGGYMYMHESVEDNDGNRFKLVGIVKGNCKRTKSLQHFGYGTMTFKKENMLGEIGDSVPIHSFHYYISTSENADCDIRKASDNDQWSEGILNDHFYGGFPHFYMQANEKILNNFYNSCTAWKERVIDDRK